ncbi:MAG TPA: tetraacyldisaccharide 4'-kinase [Thermoanaerobaculia bacterium]|nr:tetraacyldisaccharide 4'-kinase [Thermoanaerobaculia bacterium]
MSDALKPVELSYRGLNRLRRSLYSRGILKPRHLSRPVVSIGNLSMGGSGKTPTTITIARRLQQDGYRVTVLSRGYGRSSGEIGIVKGEDVERFGDEPVLMASKIFPAPVVVGADRLRAGEWFLGQGDCDLFLLDDGFQHLQLYRDVDIVIVDREARWLREGVAALEDADLVLYREQPPLSDGSSFVATLRPSACRIGSSPLSLELLKGKKLLAFSGLANNRRFFDSLAVLGAELVATRGFSDHHHFTGSEMAELNELRMKSGAELAITTEKDFVKIQDPSLAVLEVEMSIDPAEIFIGRLYDLLAAAGLPVKRGTF